VKLSSAPYRAARKYCGEINKNKKAAAKSTLAVGQWHFAVLMKHWSDAFSF